MESHESPKLVVCPYLSYEHCDWYTTSITVDPVDFLNIIAMAVRVAKLLPVGVHIDSLIVDGCC